MSSPIGIPAIGLYIFGASVIFFFLFFIENGVDYTPFQKLKRRLREKRMDLYVWIRKQGEIHA
jgi:hypothetical protein